MNQVIASSLNPPNNSALLRTANILLIISLSITLAAAQGSFVYRQLLRKYLEWYSTLHSARQNILVRQSHRKMWGRWKLDRSIQRITIFLSLALIVFLVGILCLMRLDAVVVLACGVISGFLFSVFEAIFLLSQFTTVVLRWAHLPLRRTSGSPIPGHRHRIRSWRDQALAMADVDASEDKLDAASKVHRILMDEETESAFLFSALVEIQQVYVLSNNDDLARFVEQCISSSSGLRSDSGKIDQTFSTDTVNQLLSALGLRNAAPSQCGTEQRLQSPTHSLVRQQLIRMKDHLGSLVVRWANMLWSHLRLSTIFLGSLQPPQFAPSSPADSQPPHSVLSPSSRAGHICSLLARVLASDLRLIIAQAEHDSGSALDIPPDFFPRVVSLFEQFTSAIGGEHSSTPAASWYRDTLRTVLHSHAFKLNYGNPDIPEVADIYRTVFRLACDVLVVAWPARDQTNIGMHY